MLASSYCSRKVSTSNHQSVYITSAPGLVDLKDWHIQSRRCELLLLPTPSVAPASMLVARSLTRGGVSIRIWCPSVWGGRRRASSTHHHALGFRWSSLFGRQALLQPSLPQWWPSLLAGRSAIITSSIMAYSSAGVSSFPSPTPVSASDSPCMDNCGALSSDVYSPWSSGEYISPESSCLSESITGAQQLILVIYKFNL